MEGDKEKKANGSVVEEASSTTPGEDVVTKRSIRVQTWRKIQEAKCGVGYNMIFNRIPNFVGNDKAANLLAETDEFKKAKNIKVNIDRSQDAVKVHVLSADKTLYLPPTKESSALFTKIIDCPADADEQTKRKIIKTSNLKENRQEINLDDKVKLDMIVIGSVAVSRDGYRIGKGNGFVDLNIGILSHTGFITPDTIIVTTVHDYQVTDSLPINLFQKYDTPVDLIVTPTEVIRVSKRLPRPKGIFWELLSERRLKIVPALQKIKENEEKAGKIITLKSEDTDIESNARPQRQQRNRRFKYGNRRQRSQTNNDESNKEDNNDGRPQRPRVRRRFNRRRRITNKYEGEQSSGENKENNQNQRRGGGGGGGGDNNRRNNDQRKRRGNRDFCVKVSNISKGTRIKDLKAELRKRECNPVYIAWKGAFGRCFLHFAKRKGTEKEAEIEKVLTSLSNLSLEVLEGEETKTVALEVELLKIDEETNTPNNRIESVDTTSV